MLNNKKGTIGMVAFFITASIAMILLANFLIPSVHIGTQSQPYSETIIKATNASTAKTATLTKAASGLDLETSSLVIPGLTLTTNYTIDYDTGLLTIKNTTVNGTYTANYNYYDAAYMTNSGDRILFNTLITIAIAGLIFFVGSKFGLF